MILKQNDVNVKTFSGVFRRRLSVFLIMCLFCAALFAGGAAAEIVDEKLWVNGLPVNSTNDFDVLGDGNLSTYDNVSRTLWLNNSHITSGFEYAPGYFTGIYFNNSTELVALKIMLNGTNSITLSNANSRGIYVENYGLFINGTNTTNGILSINLGDGAGEVFGINGSVAVDIINCTLDIDGTGSTVYGISSGMGMNLNNDTNLMINATGSSFGYGLNASGINFNLLSGKSATINATGTTNLSVRAITGITLIPHNIITTPDRGFVYDIGTSFTIVDVYGNTASDVVVEYGYYILNNTTLHGSILINGSTTGYNATAGTPINITTLPDTGYHLSSLNYSNGTADYTDIVFTGNTGTFTMPAENVTINAEFDYYSYDLWVNGTRVTSLNCSDVLGDGGTTTYDNDTTTLTLNGSTISSGFQYAENYGALIYYNNTSALTVMLNGENTISSASGNNTGIYADGAQLIINGTNTTNGLLTIQISEGSDIYGINGSANINITNCTLTIIGTGANATGISSLDTLNIANDTILNVTAVGASTIYGLNASAVEFDLTSTGNVTISTTSEGNSAMAIASWVSQITNASHNYIFSPYGGYLNASSPFTIMNMSGYPTTGLILAYGYDITNSTMTNGTISVTSSLGTTIYNASVGTPINVTAFPNAGYELSYLNYSNGTAYNTTITSSTPFSMPAEDIVINAYFTQKAGYDTQTVTDGMANFTSSDGQILVNLTISNSSMNGKHMAIALGTDVTPDGNIALSFDLELDPDFILVTGDYVLINATVPISNFSGIIPQSITMQHYYGGAWHDVVTTYVIEGDYILVSGNVTSFSPYAITYTTPSSSTSSNGVASSGSSTSYTVIFISDGAVVYKTSVAGTNVVAPPLDPVKIGYTFDGWYTDTTYVQKWGGTISGDTTLYAKWISNTGEPTATDVQGAIPTSSASTPLPTSTAQSPVPFLGILAGLAAVGFIASRRK